MRNTAEGKIEQLRRCEWFMIRGSGGVGQGNVNIVSPLKVPAATSLGSAAVRSSSNTSRAGAPFLFAPERLIVL